MKIILYSYDLFGVNSHGLFEWMTYFEVSLKIQIHFPVNF